MMTLLITALVLAGTVLTHSMMPHQTAEEVYDMR